MPIFRLKLKAGCGRTAFSRTNPNTGLEEMFVIDAGKNGTVFECDQDLAERHPEKFEYVDGGQKLNAEKPAMVVIPWVAEQQEEETTHEADNEEDEESVVVKLALAKKLKKVVRLHKSNEGEDTYSISEKDGTVLAEKIPTKKAVIAYLNNNFK